MLERFLLAAGRPMTAVETKVAGASIPRSRADLLRSAGAEELLTYPPEIAPPAAAFAPLGMEAEAGYSWAAGALALLQAMQSKPTVARPLAEFARDAGEPLGATALGFLALNDDKPEEVGRLFAEAGDEPWAAYWLRLPKVAGAGPIPDALFARVRAVANAGHPAAAEALGALAYFGKDIFGRTQARSRRGPSTLPLYVDRELSSASHHAECVTAVRGSGYRYGYIFPAQFEQESPIDR